MTQAEKLERLRKRRRAQQGMTLIEIMIVVGIIAMIAGGVAVALIPAFDRAKIKAAKKDTQALRSAAMLYLSDENGCPTVDELLEKRYLDSAQRRVDPFGNEFRIDCADGDLIVTSAGPNGTFDDEDDIR